MFEVISTILYVAVVIIALLLICLVLVQPSKGGGFGSAFGGIGESVFGAQAMSQLSKVTVVLLTLFFILPLILAVMTGHRSKAASTEGSVLLKQEAKAQPAAKAETKPAAPAPVKTLSSPKKTDAKPAPAKPAAAKPAAAKPDAKPAAKPAAAKPAGKTDAKPAAAKPAAKPDAKPAK